VGLPGMLARDSELSVDCSALRACPRSDVLSSSPAGLSLPPNSRAATAAAIENLAALTEEERLSRLLHARIPHTNSPSPHLFEHLLIVGPDNSAGKTQNRILFQFPQDVPYVIIM
jgi:hypothetical protein